MAFLVCTLIFIALSAGCWFVSIALYRSTFEAPNPAADPRHESTPGLAIALAGLSGFIPFPWGYLVGLVIWALAAFAGLGLSVPRALMLFMYLSVNSFLTRLMVLGLMNFMVPAKAN